MRPTDDKKIKVFRGCSLSRAQVDSLLLELREICEERDLGRLTPVIKSAAPDCTPAAAAAAGNAHQRRARSHEGRRCCVRSFAFQV
jgi:hypothetical protein